MKVSDLQFSYPEELVATEPQRPSRILLVENHNQDLWNYQESSWDNFLSKFQPGDVLVINDTQVVKRRVFADSLEILFLDPVSDGVRGTRWQVLFPSKKYSVNDKIQLPEGVEMKLIKKGRPQIVETSKVLDESYFERVGELPLPPYIQQARHERHNRRDDKSWYQTAWAEKPGSFAAPTASLHFETHHLEFLKSRGVEILKLTLHVGLGTFLPVTADDLDQHEMHSEVVQIPNDTWEKVLLAKKEGRSVWSLGTTATRALESQALGYFEKNGDTFTGSTNLLIQPGFPWQVVDRLLTNFHQPESTLLALVAAFADLSTVKSVYQFAMEQKFKLFSYGDLSVWLKDPSYAKHRSKSSERKP
jgi:S-adenosylmethionine:tRNA ribosyltransferase-isomerase